MTELDDVSSPRVVGRVRAVTDGGHVLHVELRVSGQVIKVSSQSALDFDLGSVVVVDAENNRIDEGPAELWPEEPWVGVVRLKLPDVMVLDAGGRWKMVPTSEVDCSEGNTVEVRDSVGVARVLGEDPIRYIDLPTVNDTVIGRFKATTTDEPETFADFGGMPAVVERAKELIELPLSHKDSLSKIRARPIKGVLFTGLPGTGKTMLARIIAGRAAATFYEISGPEIFSKWYGQSEEILRKLFEDASRRDRAIIFFDEIDSLAGQRGDETHEASKRVVAQLLTMMDGFSSESNVIVIAATNRPHDIDAALRRPGRFDWEIEFPLPNVSDRKAILIASSRGLATDPRLPHGWVAERTEGWSGAELTAIWSEAALLAVADERESIMAEDYVGGFTRVRDQRTRAGLSYKKGQLGGSRPSN